MIERKKALTKGFFPESKNSINAETHSILLSFTFHKSLFLMYSESLTVKFRLPYEPINTIFNKLRQSNSTHITHIRTLFLSWCLNFVFNFVYCKDERMGNKDAAHSSWREYLLGTQHKILYIIYDLPKNKVFNIVHNSFQSYFNYKPGEEDS